MPLIFCCCNPELFSILSALYNTWAFSNTHAAGALYTLSPDVFFQLVAGEPVPQGVYDRYVFEAIRFSRNMGLLDNVGREHVCNLGVLTCVHVHRIFDVLAMHALSCSHMECTHVHHHW